MPAGFVAHMGPGRLPQYLLFGDRPCDMGETKGRWNDWVRCLGEEMKAFGIAQEDWKPHQGQANVDMVLETCMAE